MARKFLVKFHRGEMEWNVRLAIGIHRDHIVRGTRAAEIGAPIVNHDVQIWLIHREEFLSNLHDGGVNFDANVRRESFGPVDLFHAHIGGMDAFALGLKIAAKIRADGVLKEFVRQRYHSWDTGIGQKIEGGQTKFEDLERYMLDKGDTTPNVSGRQEMLENIINRYLR